MQANRVFPLIYANTFKEASRTAPVFNKFTGKEFAKVGLATREEIRECFEKAHQAAKPMADLPLHARAEIMEHLHHLISQNAGELAEIIAAEAGKPIGGSRVEVTRALATLADGIKEASSGTPDGNWREVSSPAGRYSLLSRRFPIGVASFVTPFNFPLNLVMHKVAPAIAAGCPFVLKPSEQAPLSAIRLGELLAETAMPQGSFSILPCAQEDAPEFSENERIEVISFTGSPAVGWGIQARSSRKKVILELGGNAACIVDESITDLDHIAERIMFGSMFYSGQACISIQRIFVHEKHYDSLCAKLVSRAATWNGKQGDPMNENTMLGPLISEKDAIRVEDWVKEALDEHNGTLLCGGTRNGSFYDATFITDMNRSGKMWTHEIFGPVATIHKFSSFKDAIDMTNDSEFGLQAGVFTNDLQKSFYAFENIVAGGVVINDVPTARVDVQPYGGVKASGCGREGVKYAMEDLTELRVMVSKDISSMKGKE